VSAFNRRLFLKTSLAGLLSGLGVSKGLAAPLREVTGSIFPVHDPCIIREGDTYYLFCTGARLPMRRSPDLQAWELRGDALGGIPEWAKELIPASDSLWAPDISFYNDKFHLYYSVSTFGKNKSAIGLATNLTLDRQSDDYEWVDEGLVIASTLDDNFNAIDPNLILDEDGNPWLAFGSFWSGIKLRRLDIETGKPSDEDETLYSLASRPIASGSVEAPFIIRKNDFYYLFASFDFCCRGAESTYRVMVGRAEQITGPYLDQAGVPMLEGGGTQVTFPTERWRGPGHNAILQEDDTEMIVYHAYDADHNGLPTLHIEPLTWDAEGWPSINPT
jgi:arabinan endo-1,5-alpha-L-arabinosidase